MQVDDSVVPLGIGAVRDDTRSARRFHGDRLVEVKLRIHTQGDNVVKHVDQKDAPRCLFVTLGSGNEVLLAERIGMQELWPGVVVQPVTYDGNDGLRSLRDFLDDAVRFVPAFANVQQGQFAHARSCVITGQHRNDQIGRSGNGSREE